MDIPNSVFNSFDSAVTAMLNSPMAPSCILVYPPQQLECPNCIVNPFGGGSSGKYKMGGPISFTDGQICPYCQGLGVINTEETDTIKLLIDWKPAHYKDVINSGNAAKQQLAIPYGGINVVGFVADLQKFRKAIKIKVHSVLGDFDYWQYSRDGEPIPYGLRHNTFYSCNMIRMI